MREQGGGTLFSQVIDRPKLSVKVATATDSNEGKRRFSNGGSVYASYEAGTKSMLGGSILPPAAQASMPQRLKGGSTGAILVHGQRHRAAELHDLSAEQRLKELRARLEPLLKPKAAHSPSPPPLPLPPPPEESAVAPSLPQWGFGKRARRSRFEASKLNGAAAPAKALHRSSDEAVIPLRTHGSWCQSDGHSSRGLTAAPRNGIISRTAANGCAPARQAGVPGWERATSGALLHKGSGGEPSNTARQRSDGSAEVPIANNVSSGHTMGAVHISRVSGTSEALTASASFLHGKARSEPQTLEWPRILIGLSRKEKEDDFLVFKGTKLPQRPKKRPKVVERTLHYCTPGNSLCDIIRGRYDVREKKSVKKRPRGLKAMESMESDSE